MRSAALLMVFAALLPYILIKPHVGVLAWSWFSYMNPHRLTWGFTYSFQFLQIIALVTLIGWFLSKEPKRIPFNTLSCLLIFLSIWVSITTVFSLAGEYSHEKYIQTMKILFFTFVTLGLITTRERLNALIWVIAISIGFYGIKGGIFAILTGGQYLVWGPPDSFIADNNDIALAMSMVLPLMGYLFYTEQRRWLKLALLGAIGLTLLAIIASYSRGTYLGVAAAGFVFWLRSRYRISLAAVGTVAVIAVAVVFSDKIDEEIKSIGQYQEDASTASRFVMWNYGVKIALDNPVTGGGFDVFHYTPLYPRFGLRLCSSWEALVARNEGLCLMKDSGTNAHSIYFEVLGEHGFVGFGIFLSLIGMTLLIGQRIINRTKKNPDLYWATKMAEMVQLAVISYSIAGAFYNRAFFDLFYHLVAIMCILSVLLAKLPAMQPARQVWRPSTMAGAPALPRDAGTGPGVGQTASRSGRPQIGPGPAGGGSARPIGRAPEH